MGWVKRLRRAEDEAVLGMRMPHKAKMWQSWAAHNGWSYREEDGSLIGRYLPVFDGAEGYYNVLATTWHARPLLAFEHGVFRGYHGNRQPELGAVSALLVVGLPGLPPPEVVATGLEKAMLQLGGNLPHKADLSLHGTELVSFRTGLLEPEQLMHDAELLTMQINAMPPSFWRPDA